MAVSHQHPDLAAARSPASAAGFPKAPQAAAGGSPRGLTGGLTGAPRARVADLEVTFQRRGVPLRALRGVSLDVNAGEILALVGESGSGKSVLGLAMLGLLGGHPAPAVTGQAEICGTDMVTASPEQRRAVRKAHLGAVFQDPMSSLNPTMRVGRQVIESAGSASEAVRLLDLVGVPEPARRMRAYPHELSGGLRQRVMLAMAVAGHPDLVIADEPTTALDVTVQAQILALVRDLRDEVGCSFILITHDFGVAAQVADRVAVLYGGRLAEAGSMSEILAAPSHPYTAGLLRSRLDLAIPLGHQLATLPGEPPDPRAHPRATSACPNRSQQDLITASRRASARRPGAAAASGRTHRASPRWRSASQLPTPYGAPASERTSRSATAPSAGAAWPPCGRSPWRSAGASRWRSSANRAAASPPCCGWWPACSGRTGARSNGRTASRRWSSRTRERH